MAWILPFLDSARRRSTQFLVKSTAFTAVCFLPTPLSHWFCPEETSSRFAQSWKVEHNCFRLLFFEGCRLQSMSMFSILNHSYSFMVYYFIFGVALFYQNYSDLKVILYGTKDIVWLPSRPVFKPGTSKRSHILSSATSVKWQKQTYSWSGRHLTSHDVFKSTFLNPSSFLEGPKKKKNSAVMEN